MYDRNEPDAIRNPSFSILNHIYVIRGKQVMFDHDLADLYQVETKQLNQAVKRNISRFLDRFMCQVTDKEINDLRSQFATSSSNKPDEGE